MFEQLGYFKEYWIKGKSIGITQCEMDRDIIGYSGKKSEIVESDIILNNGKKIKSGTEVITMIYPLCGKMTKK